MGGEVQCIAEVCEVTECPVGQKLQKADPLDCCPVCVVDESSCKDDCGNYHNVKNLHFLFL